MSPKKVVMLAAALACRRFQIKLLRAAEKIVRGIKNSTHLDSMIGPFKTVMARVSECPSVKAVIVHSMIFHSFHLNPAMRTARNNMWSTP